MRFPVSFSQQRLWFLDQLTPGEPTYNMPYQTWLDGRLDPAALQRAMDAVVARQASLRTRFVALDGVPEQVVADTGIVTVARIKIPMTLDAEERTEKAETIASDLGKQPFDMSVGPLIRAALIEAGPDRHLLVLVMHHIISDGVSMQVLMDEFSAFYRAETSGTPVALPPLWLEYGDYAAWQRDVIRGEELDRQLAYWRRQLHGAPPVLVLPADQVRPVRPSSRGAIAKTVIDASTTRKLSDLALQANTTMFMLFLAGFAAVLSRYTHQNDIVTGTQVAGRTHTEMDPLVGLFTNTLPLRISLAGRPTFTELLGRVRDTTLDAMSHQQIPFEKLVEEFAIDRTLGQSPLIQVQFVHGSLTPPTLNIPGVTVRPRALFTGTTKLDFTLYVDAQQGGNTTLVMEYGTDLFSPAWADRFLGCMAHLLGHAAQYPDSPVAALPLLSAAEIHSLVIGRNHPNRPEPLQDPRPIDATRDVRLLLQAPGSNIIDGSVILPVEEVRDRAARIARNLVDHGVGPETRVGLCVGRGIGLVAGLLGVWWAGGAYVPLDPGFPVARLTAMASSASLRFVISDMAHRDIAASVAEGATIICVDDPAATALSPLEPVAVPTNALAYVIFTSGSTGVPKGVDIEHRAVENLITSFQRSLQLGPEDRFAAVTTFSFDIALLELLLPLAVGADLVIASAEESREPDRLRSLIERAAATAMQATPQTWRLLESAGGIPAGVRLRLCGGEALPADLAEQLLAPGATLWNVYGPTETTVWSAAGVVTDAATAADIGAPIDNTRLYVLDECLVPVPVGVLGDVWVAGDGIARGYHQQPLLTARAFRPDAWGSEPGARMYRTGDRGRWREGAGLELIGRDDHQVKFRGFRIELGEIEAALRGHRDIRQAVVISTTQAGEPALVAYIVPRRGSALAQPDADLLDQLRPHLHAAIPEYMIPALVVGLPALPLTPNGKVDRGALPAPRWGVSRTAGHVEPRNPVEVTVARIWSDLLATETPIGVHDNLFSLGGHSLTATRFVARIADTYAVSLPVHQVFAGPTIAELATAISADPNFGQVESGRHSELEGLSDDELEELLRATLAQRNRRQAIGGSFEV